jgi:hypothetical protein
MGARDREGNERPENGSGGTLTPNAEKAEDGTPGTRSHSSLRKVKSSPFLAWQNSPVCSSGRSAAVRSLATSRRSSTDSGTVAPAPPELLPPEPDDREDMSDAPSATARAVTTVAKSGV